MLAGCLEVDGMLTSQLISKRNMEVRGVNRIPEAGRNVFGIEKALWSSKPRLDIMLTSDGSPIEVTKVSVNSGPTKDTFRIKFKTSEAQAKWSEYIAPGQNQIKVSIKHLAMKRHSYMVLLYLTDHRRRGDLCKTVDGFTSAYLVQETRGCRKGLRVCC
eukprot:GHVO01012563.1.p1 GENE.GHVO01012563.1~~GHVO01012563.1.p1  ORF type:complete len:159 (-),score=8.73 GHVO01012563.1:31-507(-)